MNKYPYKNGMVDGKGKMPDDEKLS